MLLKITFILLCINFSYKYSFSNPINDSEIIETLVTDSLIASYSFNGNASDNTGLHNGTIKGAEFTTNRFSNTLSAFRFDGLDEYINLGIDFTDTYDSLSISLWIYPYDECNITDTLSINPSNDQYFLSSGGIDQSTGIYAIWNKGALQFGQSLAFSHSNEEYRSFLDNNKWHHLVMFFDATHEEASVSINGNFAYSLDYTPSTGTSSMDSLLIGKPNFVGANGFNGKIDDINIYNRKLSSDKITDLYNEGCPDSLHFNYLQIQSDTIIYARSAIQFDSITIDSSCNLELVTPIVYMSDSSYLSPISKLTIWDMDGCNHHDPVHDQHVNHRGIYINNFVSDDVLGNETKEDSLISWCHDQDFNNIYLYNIGSALSSGLQVELDSFVHKANDQMIDVTFVSAGFGTSFDNILTYHENYSNIPQGVVSEIEFWNGSGNYDTDYVPWLDRLDSLKFAIPSGEPQSLNPSLQRRFYIGKIKNPGLPPSIEIAEDLISHHDEIFLTNYHSNGYNLSTSSSENSIRNKLSLLAQAAKNLEREVDIVILFNVRQDSPAPNIWTYFSTSNDDHDFRSGFEKWYHDFTEATDIDHKEYIDIKGYGIYRWTDAKDARPDVD